jgi:glycerophosphoryl diester phosphodiesterase
MKIYAHRGASYDFPEMTMAAYENAINQGADGLECDLRLSKDLVPVLWHDATMDRCAKTAAVISESTYDQIRKIYPQILTLDELLDFAISTKKSLLLETKHPVPTGTLIEEIIVARINLKKSEIEKSGIKISIMSFSWFALEKVKRIDPSIDLVFLLHESTPSIAIRFTSAKTIGPGIEQLRKKPSLALDIKKSGRALSVWTVDAESDVNLCRHLGVDNLITNRPGHTRAILDLS